MGAIVLSPTDAASQEPVVGSVQRVVVARARAPRDVAVSEELVEDLTAFASLVVSSCVLPQVF